MLIDYTTPGFVCGLYKEMDDQLMYANGMLYIVLNNETISLVLILQRCLQSSACEEHGRDIMAELIFEIYAGNSPD
jgi:hypothetical protein